MEIILLITEDNELIENEPMIKLQNHNVLVLSNVNYFKHYLEEYMPKYIILSAKFKNYGEIAEYVNNYTDSELFITDSEEEKGLIFRNIYPGEIKNIEDLKRVLEIIDKYRSVLGIPVYKRISFILEDSRRVIANGRDSFNILDLQSGMPDLKNIIF